MVLNFNILNTTVIQRVELEYSIKRIKFTNFIYTIAINYKQWPMFLLGLEFNDLKIWKLNFSATRIF